jgi:ubiquitin carboxyl-terminal hydrolase 7
MLDRNLVIFVKYFNIKTQELVYLGHEYVPEKSLRISDILPRAKVRAGLPKDTPVAIFEEIKPGMIEQLDPSKTFAQAELGDGDILVIEQRFTEEE